MQTERGRCWETSNQIHFVAFPLFQIFILRSSRINTSAEYLNRSLCKWILQRMHKSSPEITSEIKEVYISWQITANCKRVRHQPISHECVVGSIWIRGKFARRKPELSEWRFHLNDSSAIGIFHWVRCFKLKIILLRQHAALRLQRCNVPFVYMSCLGGIFLNYSLRVGFVYYVVFY